MRKQLMLAVSSVAIFQNSFSMNGTDLVKYLKDPIEFKKHLSEIREELAAERVPLTSLPTTGITIRDINLSELKFRQGNIGVNFSNAKFIKVQFASCDFQNCNFSNCTFEECDFSNTNLRGRISGRNAVHSNITNCVFKDCNFTGADLTDCLIQNTIMDENCEVDRVKLREYTYEVSPQSNTWLIGRGFYDYSTLDGAKNLIENAWKDRERSLDGLSEKYKGNRQDGLDNDRQARAMSVQQISRFLGCLKLNLSNATFGSDSNNGSYDLHGVIFNNANLKSTTLNNPWMSDAVIGVKADLEELKVPGLYWDLSNTKVGTVTLPNECYKDLRNGKNRKSGIDMLYAAERGCNDKATKRQLGYMIRAFCQDPNFPIAN